jgi:integrase/recombinase XerC
MTELTVYQNQANEVNAFISSNLKSICNTQPCKENTRTKYFKDMTEFNAWLTGKEFSIDTVMKYRNEYLTKRTDIRTGTKNLKLAALRTLVKELYFRGIIPIDITGKLKNFNTETKHKSGLDMGEVQRVKAYIQGLTDEKKRVRLNTMFSLLTLQGFRQFEVCNILVGDFNPTDGKNGTVKIVGKGKNDTETIDLHQDTTKAVKEYLRMTGKKSGYLFTSEKGTTKGERLTERGFRKIFDSVFDELDIDRSTHGFRHFFVTTMLEATNGNIGIVKEFSRHKSTAALVMYDDRRKKVEHNEIFYTAFNL